MESSHCPFIQHNGSQMSINSVVFANYNFYSCYGMYKVLTINILKIINTFYE